MSCFLLKHKYNYNQRQIIDYMCLLSYHLLHDFRTLAPISFCSFFVLFKKKIKLELIISNSSLSPFDLSHYNNFWPQTKFTKIPNTEIISIHLPRIFQIFKSYPHLFPDISLLFFLLIPFSTNLIRIIFKKSYTGLLFIEKKKLNESIC